jgi:hypothetical protein
MSEYDQSDIKEIIEILGERVDISSIPGERDIEQINSTAFELYKESSILLNLIASMAESPEEKVHGVPRNQAICVGLIIQIAKLMLGVVQLSATRNRGEVVQALNRCILEPAINLQFLVTMDTAEHYDRFVSYSFGPERELYDDIKSNIEKAGGAVKPIETRMLESIAEKCRISNVNIDEVPVKHQEWATNMRERLKAIDRARSYITYRSLSHSIHGSWMQILQYNLDYDGATGLFKPHPHMLNVDARILLPIATVVLDAVRTYIMKFFTPIPAARYVVGRIENLVERIFEVDAAHERLYSAQNP